MKIHQKETGPIGVGLQDKIILAHKGYFDKASEKIYRENSKEICAITARKDYIKIIELDVRKSSDNILYCYHGSIWEYAIGLKLTHTISEIKQKYNVDILIDILGVIKDDKIIMLDIKDDNISSDDILHTVGNKKFKEIIIQHNSVAFLRKYDSLPKEFTKILCGNIFCTFYSFVNLKKENFKYIDVVFPFQICKKIMIEAERNGISIGCSPLFFWSQKSFWRRINKYGVRRVQSDFI